MSERLQVKIDRLEREQEELRLALANAAELLARHESGEANAHLKMQRDTLLIFARSCERWAQPEVSVRASAALDMAGLGSAKGDAALHGVDPKLAIQMLIER